MTHKKEKGDLENSILSDTLHCGIIMPIAEMDSYTESHWKDIKNIIIESIDQIEGMKFETSMVSDSSGEINTIHKNIISNIYNADIIICDISGLNPNVLFELGMRLTFDKPTIIIKDLDTPFIFDTSAIETLLYPKDLRFRTIVNFKTKLGERVKNTLQKSKDDPDYSPFLGNFGQFRVAELDQTTVTEPQQFILAELSSIKEELKLLKKDYPKQNISYFDHLLPKSKAETITVEEASNKMSIGTLQYLASTKDSRPADEVLGSKDFLKYLEDRNLFRYHILVPGNITIRFIENYQKEMGLR